MALSRRAGLIMHTLHTDVVIVGAGGAGLRAAIAVAQSDPKLRVALVSKVYPMRSHTVAAEGGAAGVIKSPDTLAAHFNDTVSGGDWMCDQAAVARERTCVGLGKGGSVRVDLGGRAN